MATLALENSSQKSNQIKKITNSTKTKHHDTIIPKERTFSSPNNREETPSALPKYVIIEKRILKARKISTVDESCRTEEKKEPGQYDPILR